ncbi:uncharacterized protein STEHIDRAFT_166349 [Stereum hirsutum FP-91666 SS1]|uniref:uncharacterized protein n=1 Tax=Stereum hirsutum (strain FP-91666) TaxID=721885 RepID=UPI000440D592|nr:uncharacterized protein STEHIDRAFT_166349 [Stereum hirsutum FP-91666 SS1]EIM90090.1 hypothetical protein STEHIDRAFT_166349 [Stereum hirsutum FP-91666 SS1]
MLDTALVSDTLGYLSIACWLGAQFPQVIENIRLQSCEGLALPFLANWFLGDMTNLLGCILTHQLPFQKYLASYFCFVDLILVMQYVHYRKPTQTIPYARSRSRTVSSLTRGYTPERAGPSHYRTISAVAANVAAAASLAARAEESGPTSPHTRLRGHHSSDGMMDSVILSGDRERTEDEDEVDEALAALADSFHSESGRKRVSWSRERHLTGGRGRQLPNAGMPLMPQQEAIEYLARGRSLQRNEVPRDAEGEEEEEEVRRAEDESQRRRSSRASRRGASMVFMGAWALFGVGTLVRNGRGVVNESGLRVGRVLGDIEVPVATVPPLVSPSLDEVAVPPPSVTLMFEQPISEDMPEHEHLPPPSTERIIGRIFAWACTTLYLTSRLPQIWKNFVRKSVDGLTISLFICAFLGNVFYVSSILLSPNMQLPPAEARAYLSESIPYLLGSGGTLMFDVTIVSQFALYRHKASPRERGRRTSVSRHIAEEEGLLGEDVEEGTTTPQRRRHPVEDRTYTED